MSSVDKLEASLNTTGSLLSVCGTAFILLCYLILPHKRHIRHAFIMNLTIADFINATNNSVSGLIVLITNRHLVDSPSCTANGFIGQLSVQAVDCSILAVTVVTWWTVTTRKSTADIPLRYVLLMCASAWVLPIITSFVALGKGLYGPVSTSWCWIVAEPAYLRYVLTHGWRFVVIFIVSGLCIYIQIYLRRHMRGIINIRQQSTYGHSSVDGPNVPMEDMAKKSFSAKVSQEDEEKIIDRVHTPETANHATWLQDPETSNTELVSLPPYPTHHESETYTQPPPTQPPSTTRRPSKPPKSVQHRVAENRARAVQKTMLLNAYPIFYIVLWIPGIANRIVEATGHSSYPLRLLQAATQFIGFANAITFGWNERIYRNLRETFGREGGARRWIID